MRGWLASVAAIGLLGLAQPVAASTFVGPSFAPEDQAVTFQFFSTVTPNDFGDSVSILGGTVTFNPGDGAAPTTVNLSSGGQAIAEAFSATYNTPGVYHPTITFSGGALESGTTQQFEQTGTQCVQFLFGLCVGTEPVFGYVAVPFSFQKPFGGGPLSQTISIFAVAPSVTEPATWAMLLLGFGAIGGALRLARRQPAVSV